MSTDQHSTDDPPPARPGRSTPRIPPLQMSGADTYQSDLLEPLGGDDALNLFRTLAHHSKLMKAWLPFGGRLLRGGALPERDRELVILRVAALCGCDYEWGQHVGIACDAGLTDPEIIRIAAPGPGGSSDTDWPAHDALLLATVDQLVGDHAVDTATWAELAATYDDTQLVELTMLAGHYAMVAGTLNSLGVETETTLPTVGTL